MTPQDAYDYLAGILPDFQSKGQTLFAQYHAANVLHTEMANGGYDTAFIDDIRDEIGRERDQWQNITDKLQPYLTFFGYTGLGIDPATLITIGAALIAIAALMISFYNTVDLDQHAAALKVIADNLELSPEDRAVVDKAVTGPSIFGSLGSLFSGLGGYLIIGGLLYFLFWHNRREYA